MKLSDEQRKEFREMKKVRIKEIRAKLANLSEEQRKAVAERFGIVTVEGHPLTPHNQCFLVAQAELNFSVIGGYQQWRKAGRSVRKGEHGFLILVPAKQKQNDSGIDNYLMDDEDVRFYSATVFDISQTETINPN